MSEQQYTPYEDVNLILGMVLTAAKEILSEQFVGMYLYGSLSSGDFNPLISDVDYVIVTESVLPDEIISALEAMHQQIWKSGVKRAARLEGAYIPKDLIRFHDPNGHSCPFINEGQFFVDRPGIDWIIQRYIIREFGIILEGPDPKLLIDPVSQDQMRQAVLGTLNEWWFPMLEHPTWLQKHECNYHGYAVITMCRALHALQHGTIVSKPVAIRWAREKLGVQWHSLIERAVASQYGQRSDFLEETLEFIRFTKGQTQGSSHAQDSS